MPAALRVLRSQLRPTRPYLTGERRLRQMLRLPNPADAIWLARRSGANVIFPVMSTPPRRSGIGLVGWVPDLQHRTHPQYFDRRASLGIEALVQRLMVACDAVVLSSETVAEQARHYYPRYANKFHVLPFPSKYAYVEPADPGDVAKKYGVDGDYYLCANQFWRHKNHLLVLEAWRELCAEGPVACFLTGLPNDPRDPANGVLSELLQGIAKYGLQDHLKVLGLVSKPELEGLMRGARGLIQPSLSEGWNTSVQDAKALDLPVLALDSPIFREQVPNASFFQNTAESLAHCVVAAEQGLRRPAVEPARERERAFALSFGASLHEVCQIASSKAGR